MCDPKLSPTAMASLLLTRREPRDPQGEPSKENPGGPWGLAVCSAPTAHVRNDLRDQLTNRALGASRVYTSSHRRRENGTGPGEVSDPPGSRSFLEGACSCCPHPPPRQTPGPLAAVTGPPPNHRCAPPFPPQLLAAGARGAHRPLRLKKHPIKTWRRV